MLFYSRFPLILLICLAGCVSKKEQPAGDADRIRYLEEWNWRQEEDIKALKRQVAALEGAYLLEPGDNLKKVADRVGISVEVLSALNPGVDPTKLKVGQRLKIR
jgi:hypothetical protein